MTVVTNIPRTDRQWDRWILAQTDADMTYAYLYYQANHPQTGRPITSTRTRSTL